jgi:hypothetical protein
MVLTSNNKKIIFVYGLFLLCISVLFSQNEFYDDYYQVSNLIQYPLEEYHDQLILTKEHVSISLYHVEIIAEYTIKNTGDTCEASLSIASFPESRFSSLSQIPENFRWFINNEEYEYHVVEGEALLGSADNDNQFHLPVSWVIANYTFPANSETIVRIQYSNQKGPYSYQREPGMVYNEFPDFYTTMRWKSTPEFSIEINNSFIMEGDPAENFWIADIVFPAKKEIDIPHLYLSLYLITLQDLKDELFTIEKISHTKWRIHFTQKYSELYERGFTILTRSWESGNIFCEVYARDLSLTRLYDLQKDKLSFISKRELGPYEFIFLTNKQLAIMRNAFYAQYGYVFTSETMKNAFSKNIADTYYNEGRLTEIDKTNIETIQKLERMFQ